MENESESERSRQESNINWIETRCWNYCCRALFACAIFNGLICGLIYKYTSHPFPGFACIQISLPLLIWEVLLAMAFCPIEVVEYYLGDFLLDPNFEQDFQRMLTNRTARTVHSAGDIIRGNRIIQALTDTESEIFTQSNRSEYLTNDISILSN